jgi:hypothetical protein
VLFHGLQRERVVEDVEIVEDDGLLDPLARRVIPVSQAVKEDGIPNRLPEQERFDRYPLDVEGESVVTTLDSQIEPADYVFKKDRPLEVSA